MRGGEEASGDDSRPAIGMAGINWTDEAVAATVAGCVEVDCEERLVDTVAAATVTADVLLMSAVDGVGVGH